MFLYEHSSKVKHTLPLFSANFQTRKHQNRIRNFVTENRSIVHAFKSSQFVSLFWSACSNQLFTRPIHTTIPFFFFVFFFLLLVFCFSFITNTSNIKRKRNKMPDLSKDTRLAQKFQIFGCI